MNPIRTPLCMTTLALTILLFGYLPAVAGEIHQAIADGDQDRAAQLLASDPTLVSSQDSTGTRDLPLHVAATHGRVEIARILLDAGAEVDGFDIDESTPLHVAALQRKAEMVDFLLAKGADVNRRDKNGACALSFAAWGGDPAIVKKMIDAGADLNQRSRDGLTLLHAATARGLTDLFDLLIEHGADVRAASNRGATAIHWASQAGQSAMVERLLAMGASPTQPDSTGESPLQKAIHSRHTEVARLLLERGADPNVADDAGSTPLFVATWQDDRDLAVLMLQHGANPNHQDQTGKTALWWAALDGGFDIVKTLVDAGAKTDVRDSETGRTPLHLAALNGHKDVAELLLQNGASPAARDNANNTPYHYAAQYGNRAVADLLFGHGSPRENVEANRGLAATDELAGEQALVWYLGHGGWAIQTKNNLLIFDYFNFGRPADEPGLCNGHILPTELNGERVTVFSTHEHRDHFDPVILDWQDKVGDLTYVFGFRPEEARDRESLPETLPSYKHIAAHQTETINNMKITTIESNDTGVGFVVEVDGLVVFHAGDHANRVRDTMAGYKDEIDWLAEQKVRPDIAFMPITGCGFGDLEAVKQGVYYVCETLEPKVFLPMHGGNREQVYREFIDKSQDAYPKTQMHAVKDRGDCFQYKDGRVS